MLDALSPEPGEQLDPETFLRERGTVFLVGTSPGASATAGLVGAFVDDVPKQPAGGRGFSGRDDDRPGPANSWASSPRPVDSDTERLGPRTPQSRRRLA